MAKSVVKERYQTGHSRHLFLTMITCGMWAPVWIAMVIKNKLGPRKRTVVRTRD